MCNEWFPCLGGNRGRSDGSYVCPECGKRYRYLRGLQQHRRYECGQEPRFKCPYCPRRCKPAGQPQESPEALQEPPEDIVSVITSLSANTMCCFSEVKAEESEWPKRKRKGRKALPLPEGCGVDGNNCGRCGKVYKNMEGLRAHLRYYCGQQPKFSLYRPGVFSCPTCGKAYNTQPGLRNHIKLYCGQAPRFECAKCHKRFYQKVHVRSHMFSVHKVAAFELKDVVEAKQ
ncbi:zinc finger protein 62 homolog [Homalodisca vitripennis]|uniref:zinc finger protein 62 homolog n=1 Tax=Homalodisca vitripennis TaxID=197043 RepID=UPI001EEB386D|nr:zinc finger protein 62 homolog [Homalodisca vitripennis]